MQFEPFSFYGLGTVSLQSLHTPEFNAGNALNTDRYEFAVPVSGDESGVFLIHSHSQRDLTNHESSEVLELINILAARITHSWESEGLDLSIGAPRKLDDSVRKRLNASGLAITHSWSGQLVGESPFEFTLSYANRESSRRNFQNVGTKTDKETASCSDIFLDSH